MCGTAFIQYYSTFLAGGVIKKNYVDDYSPVVIDMDVNNTVMPTNLAYMSGVQQHSHAFHHATLHLIFKDDFESK